MFRQRTAPRSRPLLKRTCEQLLRWGNGSMSQAQLEGMVSIVKGLVAKLLVLHKVGVQWLEIYPGAFKEHWMAASLLRRHD